MTGQMQICYFELEKFNPAHEGKKLFRGVNQLTVYAGSGNGVDYEFIR